MDLIASVKRAKSMDRIGLGLFSSPSPGPLSVTGSLATLNAPFKLSSPVVGSNIPAPPSSTSSSSKPGPLFPGFTEGLNKMRSQATLKSRAHLNLLQRVNIEREENERLDNLERS